MTTDQFKLFALHIACVVVIAGCLVLSATVLKSQPQAGAMLCVLAAWLYGKLGFVPVAIVTDKIVATAVAASMHPPAGSVVPVPPQPSGR